MRFSTTLALALPALSAAQDQVPLIDRIKGYFGQVADAVTSHVPVPAAPSAAQHVAEKVAAKVAEAKVHDLTLQNWKEVITTDPTASPPATVDWVVYINGGNTTCFGMCGNATKAWNETVALLAAKPNPPNFATVDCDEEPVLCNSWSIGPPSLYYFNIPKPLADQSAPAPTVRYIPLRRNATTTETLTKLLADKEYEQVEPYEGHFHPFTGTLQQYGLAVPLGYVLWGFSKMPSWLPMIAVSFLSRSFMGRRMNPPQANAPQGRPAQ